MIAGAIVGGTSSLIIMPTTAAGKVDSRAASAMLLGNASTIVPRLIPGAHAQAFVTDQSARLMQDQMSFFVKSFFFVLIGLMFPTSLRLVLLGAIPVLLLLAARLPAVRLATAASTCGRRGFGGRAGLLRCDHFLADLSRLMARASV